MHGQEPAMSLHFQDIFIAMTRLKFEFKSLYLGVGRQSAANLQEVYPAGRSVR
jgi:hypothetical protein